MEGEERPVENQVNSSETYTVDFIGPLMPANPQTLESKATEETQVKSISTPDKLTALQNKYLGAIIKHKPGLAGPVSRQVAQDLVEAGMKPTEAMMLINLVYGGPNYHPSGRGQGTRLKYFSEAVTDVCGDRLANASNHPALFRGLIARINDAKLLHDELPEEDFSLSFRDSLLFQEIGIDTDYFLTLADTLISEQRMSRIAATMRIKEAAEAVRNHQFSNVEGFLFQSRVGSDYMENYEQ